MPPTAVPPTTAPHSPGRHLSQKRTTWHPVFHHIPPRSASDTITTMAQTNPLTLTISTLALHPIPPLGCVRHHGQTKVQNKTAINTTMAHTPRLVLLRSSDPPLGLSYLLPPRFYPSETPALHRGPSYPAISTQLHKTTEMADAESRQSPELFQMKFLFDFIYLFTITHINNPDLCTLLYPYITIPPPPPLSSVTVYPHSFLLSCFQSCCVRAHTETHLVRF